MPICHERNLERPATSFKKKTVIDDWIELILNPLTITVNEGDQTQKAEALQAKICHFRRQEHDITMPEAALRYNSISWNVFKLWLHQTQKNTNVFPPKRTINWELIDATWVCRTFGWISESESSISVMKACFHFVFCFSRSRAFLSPDLFHQVMRVHVNMLHRSPLWRRHWVKTFLLIIIMI